MAITNLKSLLFCGLFLMAGWLGVTSQAQAVPIPVDVELQLLVDVSGSISTSEFNLQRTGYANAFLDPAIQSLILNTDGGNRKGKIAVQMVYWADHDVQSIAVDWTLLDSASAINSFSTAISGSTRPSGSQTSIQGALDFGSPLFTSNGYLGDKKIIDISGDGKNNDNAVEVPGHWEKICGNWVWISTDYREVSEARADALNIVDQINGLVIESSGSTVFNYYHDHVIGGVDSFVIKTTSFEAFGEAIKTKLYYEISGGSPDVPEPTTASLVMGALGILAMTSRRRRHA